MISEVIPLTSLPDCAEYVCMSLGEILASFESLSAVYKTYRWLGQKGKYICVSGYPTLPSKTGLALEIFIQFFGYLRVGLKLRESRRWSVSRHWSLRVNF